MNEGKKECVLCGGECESVSHVLWRIRSSSRDAFFLMLQTILGEAMYNCLDKA